MGSLLKQISANEIATVQFLKWTDLYTHEKPFQMFLEINAESNEQRTSNLQFEEKSIAVENIRGYEHLFELDKHGFIIRPFPSAPSCLRDVNRETVVSSYFPAVDELLRQELEGVDRTFLLDWRVRSADPVHHENKTTINLLDLTSRLKPANAAHIDQSPLASVKYVLREFPDEADYLLSGRVRIVKYYSPILGYACNAMTEFADHMLHQVSGYHFFMPSKIGL
ncbi:hypothetical protein BPAE_0199g00010 [Botrytis paeoniae]|uniref:Uncharacterized protein n=1 Tax=Botrytis paeoniae TaxID=278948 RepID=A0A4Z1FJA7_9HELO|nr:hypothetical protein BPAE_0199g00010 [Botrytis paeoniae]